MKRYIRIAAAMLIGMCAGLSLSSPEALAQAPARKPNIVVIWGDDQYENFREDVVPPFTVLAYGDLVCRPWDPAESTRPLPDNAWDEPAETLVQLAASADAAASCWSDRLPAMAAAPIWRPIAGSRPSICALPRGFGPN